jgi:DNA invertase Pin-like site-specific DNA recombinase
LPAFGDGAKLSEMVGAVIYVRVSTKEQTENLSLPTQLRACEEYCHRQGYEILERFHEEGESAKTTDRSQLQALLKYCRTHKGKVHFVVVYNITRFAREKYDHFALRALLKSLGISLRSATEPIDDTSTGKLMEGVLAAFAQFDNDVRSDRTRAGIRAALELGRWTFPAPLGYLNAPKWSSASLVHDPERGPLVRRAFEDLATGQYTKQEVIARATEAGLRSRKGLALSPQSFGQMMRNPIYIGKVESPDYGVSVQGDFEPVVDEATFYRAQTVLDGRVVVAGPRQRNHPDFPLRGFVRCDICGRPLTGSWSKGRNGHYAYYHCQRQCRSVNQAAGLTSKEMKTCSRCGEIKWSSSIGRSRTVPAAPAAFAGRARPKTPLSELDIEPGGRSVGAGIGNWFSASSSPSNFRRRTEWDDDSVTTTDASRDHSAHPGDPGRCARRSGR